MLKQTIYRSRCAEGLDPVVVTLEVLTVSRKRNRECGITGGMTMLDGRFLQVLEGEPAAVDALLLRLYRDDRHRDLQVLSTQSIGSRHFSVWSMAYATFPGEEQAAISRALQDPYADPDVLVERLQAALR